MTHEEAINKVRWGLMGLAINKDVRDAFETLIPELRESEDERIRKKLIKTIGYFRSRGIDQQLCDEFIAYLEKQKEQEPEQYSPLCSTIKDKINEYIANHFIADTILKTDIKSIVKAMEEGVRLGKESQKPAEWSEDDEKTISDACCWIDEYANFLMGENVEKAYVLYGLTDKLKSLHSSWKPSEAQMIALDGCLEHWTGNKCQKEFLESLYEQLKKL